MNWGGMNQGGMNRVDANRAAGDRSPRVLLIGRRFWPQCSIDQAGHLYQLAGALRRHGAAIEVLTPRYAASWPAEFTIREIPVHRPVMAPKRDWSIGRYTRGLTAWLRQHADRYDVLFCDSIREESVAAIEASRSSGCPVIVRSSGWETDSDPHWWTTSRAAQRCGTIGKMADAVIAKSAVCQRGLLTEGYAPNKVVRIEPGFAAGPIRSRHTRDLARRSLASANADLRSDVDSPILLCPSNMTRQSNITAMVRAARHLVAKFPNLRLWFIGDGPYRDWIYDTLRGDGVRASVAMPGSFCEIEDLLAAADVYFQADSDGLEYWLPSAIAAEIPIVAVDSPSTRTVADRATRCCDDEDRDRWIQWCVPDERGAIGPKSVKNGVRHVLTNLDAARRGASSLRRAALRHQPQADAIEAHLQLIGRVASRAERRHRRSTEAAS